MTWGHLLAGLWYQRRDVLLSLSKEMNMLSYKTRQQLQRTARIENMSHRHKTIKSTIGKGKKNTTSSQKVHNEENEENKNQYEPEGVDFITRMDRKLRATRMKLESKRQAEYKHDRDLANPTNKTWEQVEKGFFQRLNNTSIVSSSTSSSKGKDHEHTMRLLRTTGGKAALDLKRRSAHGFNAMCQRAKELFKTFDQDNSGWLECTDLPNLLLALNHNTKELERHWLASNVDNSADNNADNSADNHITENSRTSSTSWMEHVTKELDRNDNGAIALLDFVAWWASQCPCCFPLRGCRSEMNIDVRRIALDIHAVSWISKHSQSHYLMKEYEEWAKAAASVAVVPNASGVQHVPHVPLVPMVCESCYSCYKRSIFLETYDERNDYKNLIERTRRAQRKALEDAAL